MNRDARYTLGVLLITALVLVPIVVANYLVGVYVLTNDRLAVLAHEWQRETRGTVSVPPVAEVRFKRLTLRERLESLDTIVLGSSTLAPVQASMLGRAAGVGFYNFTVSNNGSRLIAGDTTFVAEQMPRVRLLIVGLDWATEQGVFTAGDVVRREGGLTDAASTVRPPVLDQLADALAWPRIVQLSVFLRGWARGDAAVRDLHDLPAVPAYCLRGACAPDQTCKDFDTSGMLHRHACVGYRWDGSANIAAYGHFDQTADPRGLMAPFLGIERYRPMLIAHGEPNPQVLAGVATSARRLLRRGARLVVVLPPMLPGLVKALMARPATGEYVTRVKTALAAWAEREGVTVIDANAAETMGCGQEDFFDAIHAGPACFEKVFAAFRAAQDQ